jgi:hypothetical protein
MYYCCVVVLWYTTNVERGVATRFVFFFCQLHLISQTVRTRYYIPSLASGVPTFCQSSETQCKMTKTAAAHNGQQQLQQLLSSLVIYIGVAVLVVVSVQCNAAAVSTSRRGEFRLDDYLTQAQTQTQTQTQRLGHRRAQGQDQRQHQQRVQRHSTFRLDEAMEAAMAAQENMHVHNNGGTFTSKYGGVTSVTNNRNEMEMVEDENGHPLTPEEQQAFFRQRRVSRMRAENNRRARKLQRLQRQRLQREKEREQREQLKEENESTILGNEGLEQEISEAQQAAARQNARDAARSQQAKADKDRSPFAVRLGDDAQEYGKSYQKTRAEVIDDLCVVSGLIKVSKKGYLGQLPGNCRPSARLMFATLAGGQEARVDVRIDGRMFQVTGPEHGWLSLSGLAFPVASANTKPLPLIGNYKSYGSVWTPAVYRQYGKFCVLSGLVRNGDTTGPLAVLPSKCRPDGRLSFSTSNHDHITKLDVLPNGAIMHDSTTRDKGWTNFNGLMMSRHAGEDVDLSQGWVDYENGFRPASFNVFANLCIVSGAIKAEHDDDWPHEIATLPKECRPRERLVFATNSGDQAARIDVLPDGRVMHISGSGKNNFLSLDGISFVLRQETKEQELDDEPDRDSI